MVAFWCPTPFKCVIPWLWVTSNYIISSNHTISVTNKAEGFGLSMGQQRRLWGFVGFVGGFENEDGIVYV
jgi:hypothetical protein